MEEHEERAPSRPRRFHSWLIWNILAIAACMPFGVFGLIFSIKALEARRRGDLALSDYHAKTARAFFWFAILLGLPCAVFYLWLAAIHGGAPTSP